MTSQPKPDHAAAEMQKQYAADIRHQNALEYARRVNDSPEPFHEDEVLLAEAVKTQAATIQAKAEKIKELERLVYVPGQWRCAKCKYVGIHAVICATSGAIGVKANTKTEQCPNGCGPLWRVTERQVGKELCDRLDVALDCIAALESTQRTLGTVEVCELCGRRVPVIVLDNLCHGLYKKPCPIRAAQKETEK